MQRSLRVGVVGLGTAGLSTSIFLGRLNHKVDIFEATSESDLDIVVGAGIGVQPIGLTVLNRLGVLGDILDRGSRIDRLHSTTREGKTVLDLKYADFRPELHGVGLHRDTLFRSLYDEALSTNGNVQVVPGTKVVNVSRGPNGSYLEVKGSAEKEGPYDLVVVADGRDSLRKNMSHVKQYESKYEYGCLWSILPDVTGEFTTGKGGGILHQRLDSAKTMLGLLPTGQTPKTAEDDPTLVSLFWSLPMSTVAQVKREGLDRWKDTVVDLEPRTEALVGGIKSFDQLLPAAYSDTFMPRLYDEQTMTAFVGDCAHATSPQLGQGANLALVDAWVLANAISGCDGNLEKALHQYDRERRWRLRFYQFNSRILTPVFQSNSTVVGALRDLLMGPLCRFPPTKLQMLTVLCGAQNNGWPWTTIPEEEFMGFTQDAL
jgi:2-polyprenyl-6-methoxyphenol hydroxylase-like FAD-dependent oxidoreductase